jgi:F420-dependent oxidoreductase-like protein
MKLGVTFSNFKWPGGTPKLGETLRTLASKADEVGFDSLWVMDHFFQIPYVGDVTDPMLEAYTTLGHLAAVTKRATLGTMVTGVVYREPAVLVKDVTTLDVLSGGRAVFGIGAGWNEEEAVGLGLPRPLAGDRFLKLEETLRIAKQMWAGDESPFKGRQYTLERPLNSPQPLAKPHPPILIGGGGEKKTLRLVAQYGDGCNFFGGPELPHKMDVLRQHCDDVGRNFDDIEKTSMAGMDVAAVAKDPGSLLKLAETVARQGVSHVILRGGTDPDPAHYDVLASLVLPKLRDL